MMYINSQSGEIRRLSERNQFLELENKSLAMREEIAYDEGKAEQKRNDDLTQKLFWSLSLNAAMALVIGWFVM